MSLYMIPFNCSRRKGGSEENARIIQKVMDKQISRHSKFGPVQNTCRDSVEV